MTYMYEFKVNTQEPGKLSSFDLVVAPTSAAAEAAVRAKGRTVLNSNLVGAVGEHDPATCDRCLRNASR